MKFKVPKHILVLLLVLLGASVFLIFTGTNPAEENREQNADQNVFIKVKGGYFPDEITVSSKETTKITFVTEDTYDCSAGVSIPDLGIDTVLPSTGRTEVLLPHKEPGTVVYGGCSSSLHSLTITYE